MEIAELSTAFRGTSEFALEASQQGVSCLATLRDVWPDPAIEGLSEVLRLRSIQPVLPVVIGVRSATEGVPVVGTRAFLHAFVSNPATAGVRLIHSVRPMDSAPSPSWNMRSWRRATVLDRLLDDLGSAALMVDLASMWHEAQYTRLFRS